MKVPDTKHEEGKVQCEEEDEECERRLESAYKQNGSEDEPTLKVLGIIIERLEWDLTIRKKPITLRRPPAPSAASTVDSISNPPGVKRIAKEIQKPP